ncbi:MAG: hypothetical protein JNM68_00110 [Dinghuibacter sp.]|nr:hypothetical protein [Dinghuibacter sp.]
MKIVFALLALLSAFCCRAQHAENMVVITFDGLRWQEVFNGADDSLLGNRVYVHDTAAMRKMFWAPTPEQRREKLLPFFWSVIAQNGQLHGNREYGSKVNVLNNYWFSYPGYNEMFTGNPDSTVNSNDKIPNRFTNVLEYLHTLPGYKQRVAAFSSWDCFDAILNETRAGFPVSSGFDSVATAATPRKQLLDEMQRNAPLTVGEGIRPDFFTYYQAREYVQAYKPRVLYIAFDETDDYAHEGKYDHYLYAARKTDEWIAALWNMLQQMPEYKGKTGLLILCDHGRGDRVKADWKHHGRKIEGADEIWLAAMGPGIAPRGEIKTPEQLYQAGLAKTLALLLGERFEPRHRAETDFLKALR